jgi:chitin disaccharide deacetylase
VIIVNADDWGRCRAETAAALHFFAARRITTVSGMVYMADSDRAAELARSAGMDVGLHLNLTQPFEQAGVPPGLVSDHEKVATFLSRNRYSQLLYHPALRQRFKSVYEAQAEEFERLYGSRPRRTDGHRHMHLASNMLLDGIIPEGQFVRRSFSFEKGEKSAVNRAYRRLVDWRVSSRYRTTDYFFALSQHLKLDRLRRLTGLAPDARIELMTHPVDPAEHAVLSSEQFATFLADSGVGTFRSV